MEVRHEQDGFLSHITRLAQARLSVWQVTLRVDMMPVKPTGFLPVTEGALQTVVRRIVEVLEPEKVILFGSHAYGTATPDSDVDLLVIMETNAPQVERYLAVSRLLRPRPFPVDILVRTPGEIARALETGDFFIREILTRGQVLYERDH